ncbi:MAG: hypothetical protein IJ444_02035 [Kiritimatiellae bacterium]|nr:hypothetical protein [Kiritimatiellia bacterium]
MADKTLNTRIVHKHDTEANWLKAVNFIPKQGEIIVYDIDTNYDYERIKIGDGETLVSALPFIDDAVKDSIDAVETSVSNLNTLVGDTAVATQISDAIDSVTLASLGVTATAAELNKMYGVTATTAELNYVDGVTSNIQTQLNAKAASNHTHDAATASAAGLMSAADKSKLDAITDNADAVSVTRSLTSGTKVGTITINGTGTDLYAPAAYSHPTYTAISSGLYKITVDGTGHVSGTTAVAKSDITALGIPAQDTTYSAATTSAAGLMSAADKTTLDNLDTLVGDTAVATQINNAVSTKADIAAGVYTVTATSTDGVAYVATVPGITALEAGVSFIMVPGVVSTSTSPTIDVNGLGAKGIKRRLSNLATALQTGYTVNWLTANKPFTLVYDGTAWVVEGLSKPVSADLYGSVAATKVGAGTFAGAVVAGDSYQTPATSLLRNSKLVTADTTPTNNGEICWTYE